MYTPRISSGGKPREDLTQHWTELFPELPLPDPNCKFFESWQKSNSGYACVYALQEARQWLNRIPVGIKSTNDVCKVVSNILKLNRLQIEAKKASR